MITTKIYGAKAAFCNEGCAESFQCDRDHGLIYGSYNVDGEIMGVEEASVAAAFCAYCNADLSEQEVAAVKIPRKRSRTCDQCQLMSINGVTVHERGCPNDKPKRR